MNKKIIKKQQNYKTNARIVELEKIIKENENRISQLAVDNEWLKKILDDIKNLAEKGEPKND